MSILKKLLLDECLNWRLLKAFPEHIVKTVRQMGWEGLKNGELLIKAQNEFDVLITIDKNMKYQHNFVKYNIALIVLDVFINDLKHLLPLTYKIKEHLLTIETHEVRIVKEQKDAD